MKGQAYLTARQCCAHCKKAIRTCFCALLPSFQTQPVFVILLHPREARRRVGTARIVSLGIKNSILVEGKGEDFDRHDELAKFLLDPGYFPVVLYPGRSALDLSRASPEELARFVPLEKRLLIFVIDGTWPQAKKMIHTSALLKSLPQIAFQPEKISNYRIRKQPEALCLSTVEAVHTLIELLARLKHSPLPENRSHDQLLKVFDWMVDSQIGFELAQK